MGPISMTMRCRSHAVGGITVSEETVTLVHQHAAGVARVVGSCSAYSTLNGSMLRRFAGCKDTEWVDLVNMEEALPPTTAPRQRAGGSYVPGLEWAVPAGSQTAWVQCRRAEDVLDRARQISWSKTRSSSSEHE